eukprot:TRINITY_DN9460_c0_g2_i2.p1 TRINITY_DN9460_c0_g2~~TRINITY_DN9460_c0_g2_i2.p1  ORF type:complete len:135 (-),score=20.31 TRINITY_DN9460_c0_g2_i2:359-763(-)
MNILDVIKDCLGNPYFTKNYDLQELTVSSTETRSITNASSFSNYTAFNSDPSNIDQRLLRIYMRIWTALTKAIARTVCEGNCFVSLDLGYFFPSSTMPGRFMYSPANELFDKYGYELEEDSYNVKPANRNVRKN